MEKFIQRAIQVHGNKYDYSNIQYVNSSTKVKIICEIHGDFYISPNNHINLRGCQKCGEIRMNELKKITKDEFI